MGFEGICDRAEEVRFDNDSEAMVDEAKIGEGANNSAFYSPRGYVVKPIMYDWQSDDPFEQAETVNGVDRFPWVEVEELVSDNAFNRAMVRMPAADLTHEQAAEAFHLSDVIEADLDMFVDLREEDITYTDFKPDNLGYFWEDDGMLGPKPIDIFDGYAWREEEELEDRKFASILDTYIQGTEDEPGLADNYPISVLEAERQVMDYFGMDEEHLDGDPYNDLQEAVGEEEYDFL